ncbi:MAG: methyltransferase domain-containing protein [Bacteroidia bacterium]|jgi:2-polyprenyl-3-methyl-5-hydroxy-6-metoxy-1,4-benzoquinol methylase|nr:methyltransferase domain-containing protein [Bacteroidia bacterium]
MKPNFAIRSNEFELLDQKEIPAADLFQNLKELETINTLLGGHAVTIKGLKKLKLMPTQTYRILDIGSGGGDTLKTIAKWGRVSGYTFELVGVDLKAECIEYATNNCKMYPEISFIHADYKSIISTYHPYDIIVTSLFCHHLTTSELTELIEWGKANARLGLVVNDLHRHPFAYYSIWLLTALFSKSYLVQNDAKLSVLRGFVKKDWQLVIPSNVKMRCSWQWAFRWLVLIEQDERN